MVKRENEDGTFTIEFTAESFALFMQVYKEAEEKGDEEFTFKGEEFYTDYAKYLVEYYETFIKEKKE